MSALNHSSAKLVLQFDLHLLTGLDKLRPLLFHVVPHSMGGINFRKVNKCYYTVKNGSLL